MPNESHESSGAESSTTSEIGEGGFKTLLLIIVILLVLGVFILILHQLTGGRLVRTIICGALFWIPLGGLASALTQGCTAIPV